MNLLTLLEDLDEELSKSASVPLTGKRLVDVEKCLDIVSELRVSLPDDVRDAEIIVRDRDRILNQHAIVQEAQHRASVIVGEAIAQADAEADSCTTYLVDVLGSVEQHLARVLDDVHHNRVEVMRSAGMDAPAQKQQR